MNVLTHDTALQVLLLQAAGDGRGPIHFGESLQRAKEIVPPFLIGDTFPDVYLEHPLMGDPFLDVTVLLQQIDAGMRVASPLAGDHGAMLDFYARERLRHENISCGFEIDTSKQEPPVAAVHFQPRMNTELVRPFFEAIREPERADLYLDLASHMPKEWPLSFFGMFRGRPGSPLRVCGYLSDNGRVPKVDPARLAAALDAIGFDAYDDELLVQASTLIAVAPEAVDFQFDVTSDGTLGPSFALDVKFGIGQPAAVRASFTDGPGAHIMQLLEGWGAADGRWRRAVRSAFATSLPLEPEDGKHRSFAFVLMPQWVKARWTSGVLQPAKLYHYAHAAIMGS